MLQKIVKFKKIKNPKLHFQLFKQNSTKIITAFALGEPTAGNRATYPLCCKMQKQTANTGSIMDQQRTTVYNHTNWFEADLITSHSDYVTNY